MTKKDTNPRFIRRVLLLNEFDFEVKDRRACENEVADQISMFEAKKKKELELQIKDNFLVSRY